MTNSPLAITGGPGTGESLEEWKTRLRSELTKQNPAKQARAGRSRSEERAGVEPGGGDAAPVGRDSSSGVGGSEHLFRVQVASFADLDELTREGRKTLEEVKGLLVRPAAAGGFPSGTELSDKLHELNSLVAMAKSLGEMTVSPSLATAVGTRQRWVVAGLE